MLEGRNSRAKTTMDRNGLGFSRYGSNFVKQEGRNVYGSVESRGQERKPWQDYM